MIKLFVSDLDNTLFNHEKQVAPEDQKALKALMEAGLHIALASGRMDHELVKIGNLLQGRFHRISQNGAFIYTRDGECLQSVTFSGKLSRQIYREAKSFELPCFINLENEMFVAEKTDAVLAIKKRMKLSVQVLPEMDKELGKTLFPSKITCFGHPEKLRQLNRHIRQTFPSQVDSFISDRDCLDFMPPGISKGASLKKLADEFGFKPEEIVTIGDSFNDVSMLRLTPHSFAMQHAPAEVKQHATYVVSSVHEAAEQVLAHNRKHSESLTQT
ncbi:Cof-type HAD-IIB family hydrolase [Thermoactinomyces mirandus]|uniref:Cof-type HAD-IIB family hydrolase n=1 Tax=Thermoactinomyces mirandus TaxID=2756294 RepID=A0A7W2ARZ6_9BACL|nr:Cof-type HAD-IIB family hydrolase [Thermoactinomyces mirandus]MBA4601911.1 Cof-type HAD-IIB family hydrolase [Thermoactinomyces mirandus]